MPEFLRKMIERIVEWWKKFTTKQRVLLISIVAVIILALVILAYSVSRPNNVILVEAASASEASSIQTLLEEEGIAYDTDSSGFVFYVEEKDKAQASILLGSNSIPAAGYDINDAITGSFSMTTSDKQKLYQDYLEKKLASDLSELDLVEDATVQLTMAEDNGTILSSEEDNSASVQLALNGSMDEEQAAGIARYVATALGNKNTDEITILDRSTATVLFSGAELATTSGLSSTQLNTKQKQSNIIKNEVVSALAKSKIFSDVQVALNLDMSFDETTIANHEFSTMDGSNKGPVTSESTYSATATGGQAAVPGTDSNDDTTYTTQAGDIEESTVDQTDTKYATNEKITETKSSGGAINYDTSSISVVATKYRVYKEADMKALGELDDISWEEFKAQNADPVAVDDVNNEYLNLISKATGFPVENIAVKCNEQPIFEDDSSAGAFEISDILQIVLAVLIFALLGYVVFRSTRTQKEEELEAELSVESLLESTNENVETLEDIGYTEKSETRIMIEKFVDENPDAAALLLRNWLNEDWE